jgi:beta-hydroxylase
MIISIILIIFLSLFLFTWYKEPRIFLLIFHRITFSIRKGDALHIDKQLNFAGSILLEKNWPLIYEELKTVLVVSKPLPKFHEVDRSNYKISFDDGPAWRTLVLKAYDGWFTSNCKMFPQTFRLLADLPEVSTVMFSILEPYVKIPPHTGKFSGIWRYHLALLVPTGEGCFIEVKRDKYFWKEGEGILFNDTYLHSVTNNTDGYRIVLFLDITKRSSYFVKAVNKFILHLIRISPVFKRALQTGVINEI